MTKSTKWTGGLIWRFDYCDFMYSDEANWWKQHSLPFGWSVISWGEEVKQ